MESVRLHRTHEDYQRRGPGRNKYIW
jgi:hypothetical protein